MATAIAVFVIVTPFAHGQTPSSFERRSHAFRILLNRNGMTPVASVDDALENPRDTLIVLLGPCLQTEHQMLNGRLGSFIEGGGALLVASDRPVGPCVEETLGINVVPQLLQGPPYRPFDLYRGAEIDCPLVRFDIPREFRAPEIPFSQLANVATNRPSYLDMDLRSARGRIMARLPPGCQPIRGGLRGDHPPWFAAGRRMGAGKYAMLADHTLFLNLMLLKRDNDNIQFAVALTDWLSDSGKRSRVLFVDEDTIRTDFDLDLNYLDPPLPHPDVLGPMFDQVMYALEQEDTFNGLINRFIPSRVIVRSVILAGSVLAAAYALWRITAGRWRIDARSARLPERVSELVVVASPAELRRFAASPAATTLAARELARRTFDELGVGKSPPTVTSRRRWVRSVNRLWAIATGADTTPLSAARLEALAQELDDLRLAVARGDVRLQPA